MSEPKSHPRHRSALKTLGLVVLYANVAACSLGTEESNRADTARLQISVSAPQPLTLVTSIDFFETYDQVEDKILTNFNVSDTTLVDAGVDETFQLGELGSFIARLIETENETATIEMRVWIDGVLEFERTGTMRDALLEYKYVSTGRRF